MRTRGRPRWRVLAADDDERVLALLSAALRRAGRYRLLLARDGEEALAVARRERPDLVLLDILMPRLDGYAVCRALKSDPATASTRVVVLTALAQEADRRRAAEAGADAYVTKPFSPAELLRQVQALLDAGGEGARGGTAEG